MRRPCLEVTKNGNDLLLLIIINIGSVIPLRAVILFGYRCLGKSCKASVNTDKYKIGIYFFDEEYSGPRQVTMCSLISTPPERRKRPAPATV